MRQSKYKVLPHFQLFMSVHGSATASLSLRYQRVGIVDDKGRRNYEITYRSLTIRNQRNVNMSLQFRIRWHKLIYDPSHAITA